MTVIITIQLGHLPDEFKELPKSIVDAGGRGTLHCHHQCHHCLPRSSQTDITSQLNHSSSYSQQLLYYKVHTIIPPTSKRKEDVPGNDGGGNLGIRLALPFYIIMVIRLVSLDCTIYLLGVAECLPTEVEVGRLIGTCIQVH